ncbi:MAG: RsmD family RNA methyltransferase [Deltaproteobacteria bacterium]|nr:RsmD family RNA methyltransferase [Deltaproteobacteria bacterium]
MIRLSGGIAGGRVLREPVPDGVRPTSARVREALFSLVGQDLAGVRFLDAFGGAGLVGLEAWSRGAEVVVVERSRKALEGIRRRGAEVGASWSIQGGDVLQLAGGLGLFDGVFADPPYEVEPTPVLEALAPLARGWLVFEAEVGREFPDQVGGLALDRHRAYGRRGLWVFRPVVR